MTREDYIVIAEALADGFIMSDSGYQPSIVRQMTTALGRDNPRFDAARFTAHVRNCTNGVSS